MKLSLYIGSRKNGKDFLILWKGNRGGSCFIFVSMHFLGGGEG
jgi:hypothetical protein